MVESFDSGTIQHIREDASKRTCLGPHRKDGQSPRSEEVLGGEVLPKRETP